MKYLNGSDFDVKNRLAPQKSVENDEKLIFETNFLSIFFFGVEKSKVANRPKRMLPKFGADRSQVRGVKGRSKFVVAVWPAHLAYRTFSEA